MVPRPPGSRPGARNPFSRIDACSSAYPTTRPPSRGRTRSPRCRERSAPPSRAPLCRRCGLRPTRGSRLVTGGASSQQQGLWIGNGDEASSSVHSAPMAPLARRGLCPPAPSTTAGTHPPTTSSRADRVGGSVTSERVEARFLRRRALSALSFAQEARRAVRLARGRLLSRPRARFSLARHAAPSAAAPSSAVHPQDIFHVFSMFLDEQEFTYTSSVLAKELVARGFAAPLGRRRR